MIVLRSGCAHFDLVGVCPSCGCMVGVKDDEVFRENRAFDPTRPDHCYSQTCVRCPECHNDTIDVYRAFASDVVKAANKLARRMTDAD